MLSFVIVDLPDNKGLQSVSLGLDKHASLIQSPDFHRNLRMGPLSWSDA
jgi:hypothetical protein